MFCVKFRYTGEGMTEAFGLHWGQGIVHDVTDEHVIRKLSHNHLFEQVDGSGPPKQKAELPPPRVALPPALENLLEQQVEPPHMPVEHHEPSIKPLQPPRRGRRPNQDR